MQHPTNTPEEFALSALLFLPLALLWLAYEWVLAEFGGGAERACPSVEVRD
ncbi:MAG: hypothetical protein ACYS26_21950 [Planctomycetota bacterium]|jgi:hypothetical protein